MGYGLDLPFGLRMPVGRLEHITAGSIALVTTTEDLQHPMTPELAEAYKTDGVVFAALGPLLDCEGAQRAGVHRFSSKTHDSSTSSNFDDVVEKVAGARRT